MELPKNHGIMTMPLGRSQPWNTSSSTNPINRDRSFPSQNKRCGWTNKSLLLNYQKFVKIVQNTHFKQRQNKKKSAIHLKITKVLTSTDFIRNKSQFMSVHFKGSIQEKLKINQKINQKMGLRVASRGRLEGHWQHSNEFKTYIQRIIKYTNY